ncbi:MAG: HlyD family efflux transporter periplasmic adaptor subunit [Bacteroidales bacterium]|nr:HlyD family efflux transporter periplasmic adaptor subunit [Bacteroidales bacterium]
MKIKRTLILLTMITGLLVSCKQNKVVSDAYGNFEAVETTISSEASGRILWLDIMEGQVLKGGDTVGLIDTTDLHYKKLQLQAQKSAIESKSASINAQAAVYNQQKSNLTNDLRRIENLMKDQAATPKQLDDVTGSIRVTEQQIISVRTQLAAVSDEIKAIDAQIAQVGEALKRCFLINTVEGTVLSRYAETGEVTAFGKPLYKIANLKTMDLRVYISGKMLSEVKTGQKARVLIDSDKGMSELEGVVTWVSPAAEFTPKIIQTREERVNLVYAVKLSVVNDGRLKIAMPAEVVFIK